MRRNLGVAALLVAGGLAVVACGSKSSSVSTEAPASTEAGPRVVTIGVITPQVAGLTDFGLGILHSVELAVAQANEANAVPGWTIKVRALDDSSDPELGKKAAAEMIADESVVGLVGPYNSGVSAAMLPELAAAGLPMISSSNTLTDLTLGSDQASPKRQFANYFRMVGADDKQSLFLAEQAYAAGYRKVAVVSETKAVSKGLADRFVPAFEALGGTVVVREVVADGATDFADFIAKANAAQPDFVFFGGEYPVAAALRKQAVAGGLTVALMGGDGIKDDALIAQAGADAEGIVASSVGRPLDSMSSAAAFLSSYQAAGYPHPSSAYGPYAYDAANAIIRALPASLNGKQKPIDARNVLLKALMTVSFDGASGKVAFDQYGDTLYPVFTLYTVKNGAWVPVS